MNDSQAPRYARALQKGRKNSGSNMKQKLFTFLLLSSIVFLIVEGISSCGVAANFGNASPAATVVPHSPTIPPTVTPPKGAHSLTLTMDDNGKHVLIKQGDLILIALDDTFYSKWTIVVADPTILTIIQDATLPLHSQALYKAAQSGQTTLTATGEPKCRNSVPPCQIEPRPFTVQITVE